MQQPELSQPGQSAADTRSFDLVSHPALIDALDRAQFGVIITSHARPPAFVNAYARRVLEQRDGLTSVAGGLEVLRSSDTRLLRDAVDKACRRQLTSCVTLMLPRATDSRAFAVHVPAPSQGGASAQLATVFVCDPGYEPVIAEASLTRMYGLTRAEAALAALLLKGKTIDEVAEALFISIHTARTHLKRILLKTDTGRQAELLRLLLACSAQVRLE